MQHTNLPLPLRSPPFSNAFNEAALSPTHPACYWVYIATQKLLPEGLEMEFNTQI